jgi:ribokinase
LFRNIIYPEYRQPDENKERRLIMNKHIVVVGSLNMDLVVHSPHHPLAGETIIGTDFRTFPGGKGANQAVAAARLGGKVRMIGRVGSDEFGNTLISTIKAAGVDTNYIQQDGDAATGVALITVDHTGQNTIVVAPGANGRLSAEDISTAEDAFINADSLVMQLEIPLSVVKRSMELASLHGLQVILNPAPAQKLEPDFLSRVDYLIPNQNELTMLTGLDSIPLAINQLMTWGIKNVIVTLGGDGVLFTENGKQVHIPAHDVPVIDTTAAGDAFVGAFAVATVEGLPLRQAVAWGNAAGALAVMTAGAQPSLPTREIFTQFLK